MTSASHLRTTVGTSMAHPVAAEAYALRSELAHFCLPAAHQDAQRKLAWVDSLCLGFLIIGLIGIKPPVPPVLTVAPLEEPMTAAIEPPPPTEPQELAPSQPEEISEQPPDSPQVIAVALPSPSFNFSVPTRGNLIVPSAMASAPPARPMQALEQKAAMPVATILRPQGRGSDRPEPSFPHSLIDGGSMGTRKEILQRGTLEQHPLALLAVVETNGVLSALTVEASSGFPQLDQYTLDWVKKHWTFPRAATELSYKIPIGYNVK
jgi:hypothetical protein